MTKLKIYLLRLMVASAILLGLSTISFGQEVNDIKVRVVNYAGAGGESGMFVENRPGEWFQIKKGEEGRPAILTEYDRDQWSVYLKRESDGRDIQLDLNLRKVFLDRTIIIYDITSFH